MLSTFGLCQRTAGLFDEAIALHEQVLALDRASPNNAGEAADLGNLAECHRDLGRLDEAMEYYGQALVIARETSRRYEESGILAGLAETHGDLGDWDKAADYCRQAIAVADAISISQIQNEARLGLARIRLLSGDPAAALQAARAAGDYSLPLLAARVSVLLGISQLRSAQAAAADRSFRDAVARADRQLRRALSAYDQHDLRALALCGLALTGEPGQVAPGRVAEAAAAFRAARTITSAPGVVAQVLGLFDALAVADADGILAAVRPAAAGEG